MAPATTLHAMGTRVLTCASLLIALAISGSCASLGPRRPGDVAWTWAWARVWLPGMVGWVSMGNEDVLRWIVSKMPADRPLPLVLYLHGCAGISPDAPEWARTLTEAGYVVIAPDSFAREYRPPTCSPLTYHSKPSPEVDAMRQEEIAYAGMQIRRMSWVDQENVFLLGHSEGGIATAHYAGTFFKGHIISAWICNAPPPYEWLQGLWVRPEKPVLALRFANDPWFRRPGHCGDYFGRRKDARSIVLEGSGHSTADHPVAKEAVIQFLKEHTGRRR